MSISKERNLRATGLLLVAGLVVAHFCFLILPSVFETWNKKAVDRLFLFRSMSNRLRPHYDDTIVHVDINNSTIRELDNYYLNRIHHARAIRNLARMNVSTQLYDFIFAARSNEVEDNALIEATSEAGNVYFGMAFDLVEESSSNHKDRPKRADIKYLDRTKWRVLADGDPMEFYTGRNPLLTFPALSSVSKGLGYLNVKPDLDGVFRRVPLLVRSHGAFYPSYAFRAACDYLNVTPENIVVKPGKSITMKYARRSGSKRVHDIVIPIDRRGNMIINFIGPWERMKHYNFADILRASEDRDEMEMWTEELSGKIVIISEVSTGTVDVGPVPTDTNFPLSALHANAIHTILTGSFLRELSSLEMSLIELSLLLVFLILSARLSSIPFSLGCIVVVGGYLCLSAACFFWANLILHIVRPLLQSVFSIALVVGFRYISEERARKVIRATFGRHLSDEVVEELLGSPEGSKMGGEIREVTFLVSDLRGFTSLASNLPPDRVIPILNRYFECMIEIVARYRGTVDELQGDGMLVFFGAPLAGTDDQERAVACAVEMQNAMLELNADHRKLNLPELSMGIGINSGEVVVGNIGSEKRAKYGAIGTTINTAFRIESHTIGGQILISQSTYEKVRSLVRIRGTTEVQLKGLDGPLTLYDVSGIMGKYQLSVKGERKERFVMLEPEVPIRCFLLEDKMVSKKGISGSITRLAESWAEISVGAELDIHTNLKIILLPQGSAGFSEIYGKVMSHCDPCGAPSNCVVRIVFTWLPDDAKAFLAEKRSLKGRLEKR